MWLDDLLAKHPELKSLPLLSQAEFEALMKGLPGEPSAETRRLLSKYGGVELPDRTQVDWSGRALKFKFQDVFDGSIPVLSDGSGNFFCVDVMRDGAWGAVLFCSHDPAVIVVAASSLSQFVNHLVIDKKVFIDRIWGLVSLAAATDNEGLSASDILESDSAEVREFVLGLPSNSVVYDLRDDGVPGFPWGRFGPYSLCRRAPNLLLFAVSPAPSPPQAVGFRGLLDRWFRKH